MPHSGFVKAFTKLSSVNPFPQMTWKTCHQFVHVAQDYQGCVLSGFRAQDHFADRLPSEQGQGGMIVKAQGYWQNDMLSGLAIRYYNATHHYSGQFHDDQRSGHGLEYVNRTLVYEGQFKEDLRWGYGTEYDLNSKVNYRGQWARGLWNGFGRQVLKGGEDNYYEGHFVNGRRDGQGILKMPNRHYSYDGQWNQDEMNGFGTQKHNGSTYEGNFKDNVFHGQVSFSSARPRHHE